MKSFQTIIIAGTLILQSLAPAALHAEDSNPVKVTGELRKELSVQLSQSEMDQLLESIKKLPQLEPYTVDINDLYAAGDEAAIQRVKQLFISLFVETATDLVEMKAIILQLAARMTLPEGQAYKEDLYRVYSKKLQASYDQMIRRYADENVFQEVINACQSDLCAIHVAQAVMEMIQFAEKLNQGFRVDELDDLDVEWKFQNRFLQASLAESVRAYLPSNRATTPIYPLVAGTLGAFAYAAKESVNFGRLLSEILLGGSVTRLEVKVEPAPLSLDRLQIRIAHYLKRKLEAVTLRVPVDNVQQEPEKYFVNVLSCKLSDKGGGFIFVGGYLQYSCYSDRETGAGNHYSADVFMGGVGAWGAGIGRALIVITSPVEMDSTGVWVGFMARAALGGGSSIALMAGPYGSIAKMITADVGGGFAVGGQVLKID